MMNTKQLLLFFMISYLSITYSDAKNTYSISEINLKNVPDIQLLDSTGKSHPVKTVLYGEKPVLLQFVFTSCAGVCPVLSSMMRSVQDDLENTTRLVSISIDPEYDTPQILAEYAKRFHAKSHWLFYTGEINDIIQLQKSFAIYEANKMRHKTLSFLGSNGRWKRIEGFLSRANLLNEVLAR